MASPATRARLGSDYSCLTETSMKRAQIVSEPVDERREGFIAEAAAASSQPGNLEISALANLGLSELRGAWMTRYGEPPRLRSPDLLRVMLAWRLQAETFGGLDGAAIRALRGPNRLGLRERLNPGDRISREYHGVRHEVEVTADGYRYLDTVYPTLSAVARQITGTKWNGWRFFGLPAR